MLYEIAYKTYNTYSTYNTYKLFPRGSPPAPRKCDFKIVFSAQNISTEKLPHVYFKAVKRGVFRGVFGAAKYGVYG